MTRTKKILIIGCGSAVLLVATIVGLLAWFAYQKKDEWKAKGKELRLEGEQAGKVLSESGCLDQAMARYRTDGGRIGEIRVRLWLSGCLDRAQREGAFCSSVPSRNEIASTVAWRLQTCSKFGFEGDSICANLLAEVQDHCENPHRREVERNP